MNKDRAVSNSLYAIFLITASVGSIGQAWLLYRQLVDNYPYKVMSFPPATFYETVAIWGFLIAPVVAIGSGILAGMRNRWLVGILPVVLCPVIFLGVFLVFSLVYAITGEVETGRNFDGIRPSDVAFGFVYYVFWLSIAGPCCALFLNYISYKNDHQGNLAWKLLKKYV